jgi:hypothetical protein
MSVFRWLKWLGLTSLILVCLLMLLVVAENLRGKRAWVAFQTEMQAKGERLDLEFERPGPVPDEQNFAMTPLLAGLHDYQFDPETRHVKWRDTNAMERPRSLFGWRRHTEGRSAGWRGAEFADLAGWQRELRAQTNSADPQIRALLATPPGKPEADLLFLLSLNASELDEIRTASQRPYARFKVHVDEGFFALLPELAVIKNLTGAFQVKALAELVAGQTDAAFADTQAALVMSDALRSKHMLIGGMVRIACLEMAMQPLWEGLARRQWAAAQLERFQSQLEEINLADEMLRDLRGERIYTVAALEMMRRDPKRVSGMVGQDVEWGALRFMPPGWYYQNQINIARMYQDCLRVLDPERRTVDLAAADQITADFDRRLRRKHPYTIFAAMLFPGIDRPVARTARAQATVALADTACALERFRLETGRYPETLEALVPRYMGRLPLDPVSGEPLKYRVREDGRFVLHAVGLNRTDDGGIVPRDKKGRVQTDQKDGDWVWQYPTR